MNFWKDDLFEWLKVFVPLFVAFNIVTEVGLSFVPKAQHAHVAMSWIVSGVAMLLWGHFGNWDV